MGLCARDVQKERQCEGGGPPGRGCLLSFLFFLLAPLLTYQERLGLPQNEAANRLCISHSLRRVTEAIIHMSSHVGAAVAGQTASRVQVCGFRALRSRVWNVQPETEVLHCCMQSSALPI